MKKLTVGVACGLCGLLMTLIMTMISCSTTKTIPQKNTGLEGPQLIRSDYQPGEITRLCKEMIATTTARLDNVGKLPATARNFDNTLLEFETATADFTDLSNALVFMAYVSPDAKLREEASTCEEEVGKFGVSVFTRKDLYVAIKDQLPRNGDEKRLLSETIKKFDHNGLKLPDAQLAVVKEKMQRIAVLESQFSSNLNNDTTTVEFSPKEMAGVPESFISRQKKTADGTKLIVTTKAPDYKEVMENASSPETRKRMQSAYMNRAADKNMKILEETIPLRRETAHLLGFKNWADYKTDGRMAKTANTVLDFLSGLKNKLSERNRKDMAELLRYKKSYDKNARSIDMWDLYFLAYQLKKRDYDLDDEKIREYFPTDRVIQGVFDIYSKLLGVSFRELKDAPKWAPDVTVYEIVDAPSKKVIGYFYADFYPRPGKYGHFAAFPLTLGRALQGGYAKPISALVGNFPPPSNGKPSLLKHEDVETIFHEFGHIMHQTLTRAPYSSLAGSEVQRDFVEAPSQMLEEWAWAPSIIENLSRHYLRGGEHLPKPMVNKMIKARNFNQGNFYTRQLWLASVDMTYHTSEQPLDLIATSDRLYKEFIGIPSIPGGHFPATFGHLMGGYDAGYYGYLWSEVYAMDMSTRFQKGGFLNPEVGMAYRKTVLEKGNMEDGDRLVTEFLKRKPNNKAFFKKLGIKD